MLPFTTTVNPSLPIITEYLEYLLEYGLSGHRNMVMKVNPELFKAKHLRIWYDAGGRLNSTQTKTTRPASEGKHCHIAFP